MNTVEEGGVSVDRRSCRWRDEWRASASAFGKGQAREIGDQSGAGRLPSQLGARSLAQGRHVVAGEHRKPAEMRRCLFRGNRPNRQFRRRAMVSTISRMTTPFSWIEPRWTSALPRRVD